MTSTVLLYSGGLDSYCLAHLTHPDVLLHVATRSRYGPTELDRLRVPPGADAQLVVRDDMPFLGALEDPVNFYVPGRNAYMVLMAANYGDRILLGAVKADTAHDKDMVFREHMNCLLAHLYKPDFWLPEGRRVWLDLPGRSFTKRELVAAFLDAGGDGDRLAREAFSCFTPVGGRPCTTCKACGRFWMTLTLNGIDPGWSGREALRPYITEIESGAEWTRGDDQRRDVLEAWGMGA